MITYADVVTGVAISGGNVKLKLSTRDKKDGQGEGETIVTETGTLVLPIQGFIELAGLVGQVMSEMEKRGVVKRGTEPLVSEKKVEGKTKA
jgi:hypothetical protein